MRDGADELESGPAQEPRACRITILQNSHRPAYASARNDSSKAGRCRASEPCLRAEPRVQADSFSAVRSGPSMYKPMWLG